METEGTWNRNESRFAPARVVVGLICARLTGSAVQAQDLVPLAIKTPIPAFIGTPPELPESEHIEKPSEELRPPFLAPKGTGNVALNKRVILSDLNPINGTYTALNRWTEIEVHGLPAE